eukprot:319310_1
MAESSSSTPSPERLAEPPPAPAGDAAEAAPASRDKVKDTNNVTDGKHPLHRQWTLHYDSKKSAKPGKWAENLHEVSKFQTVEEFWATFNHIKAPSELEHGATYHLFFGATQPAWEDVVNRNGGKWTHTLTKNDEKKMDEMWINLVLATVGETLDEDIDQVCGIVFQRRKTGSKISLWTSNKNDAENCKKLGSRFKEYALIGPTTKIDFLDHQTATAIGRSYAGQALYTLPESSS